MSAAAIALAFSFLVVAKPPADAQALPSAVDLANGAIERGIAHLRRDEYADALREFLAARVLAPSPRATAQVGLAEQALGRFPEAERHLTEALATPDDRWVHGRHAALEASLKEVEARLGTLDVQGYPPGADVRVDGKVVGALPLLHPLRWPVGAASVEVSMSSRRSFSRAVDVKAGQLVALWAELEPSSVAAMAEPSRPTIAASPVLLAPPTATGHGDSGRLTTVSWVCAIAGAIAAGVGAALWASGHDRLGTGAVAGGAGAVIAGGFGFVLGNISD
jgi:tetratricopeptide (TPR) repeat protein